MDDGFVRHLGLAGFKAGEPALGPEARLNHSRLFEPSHELASIRQGRVASIGTGLEDRPGAPRAVGEERRADHFAARLQAASELSVAHKPTLLSALISACTQTVLCAFGYVTIQP